MMIAKGLAKLIEECGELTQIAGKKLAYFNTDVHPDGKGSMAARLQEEIADVLAACELVSENFALDQGVIAERRGRKLALFRAWQADSRNTEDSASLNQALKAGPNLLYLRDGGMICGWCAAPVVMKPRTCCGQARTWDESAGCAPKPA